MQHDSCAVHVLAVKEAFTLKGKHRIMDAPATTWHAYFFMASIAGVRFGISGPFEAYQARLEVGLPIGHLQ